MKTKIGNVYRDDSHDNTGFISRNHDIYWMETKKKTVLIEFTMFNFERTDLENKPWFWGVHTNPRGFRGLVLQEMYTKTLNME